MTFCTRNIRRLLGLAALAAIALLLPCGAHAEDQAAWQLLWGNKLGAAQTAFRADLKANPGDADAQRGMGWIYYFTDNDHACLSSWSRAIQLDPTNWTTAGLWPFMVQEAEPMRDMAIIAPAAKSLLASPDVAPVLRTSAQMVLAHEAQISGGYTGNGYVKSLGIIADWRVIGPFDNVSKSGLNKQFPPDSTIRYSDQISGKDDLTIAWHRCPLISRDGIVNVGGYLGDGESDVFYAATAVNAPADTDAQISFDVSGASKLFVNGAQVFGDSVYRDGQYDLPDAFSVPVHLHQGWNTLLFKVASDARSRTDFQLGVTAASREKLVADSAKADGATAPAGAESDALNPAQTNIGALLGKNSTSVEGAFLLGLYLEGCSDYQSSEDVLNAAIESHPNCGALYAQLSDALSNDGQDDASRAARDSARQLDHDMESVELSYLTDQKDSGTKSAYVKQLQALAHQFPSSADVLFALASALQDAGFEDQAFSAAKQAVLIEGPSAIFILATNYEFDDQQKQINAMVKTAASADPGNIMLWKCNADDLDAAQDTAGSIAAYQHLINIMPESSTVLGSLAEEYRTAGSLSKALPYYALQAEDRPEDSGVQSDYGQALQDMGHTAQAIAQYKLAIELDPGKVDLRDKLQLLTGQKPVADLAAALPTPDLDKLRGAPAGEAPSVVYLIDEDREVVYPDYATQSRIHDVLKINDQFGVERNQTYELDRSSATTQVTLESARLIKADGKIEDHTNDDTGEIGGNGPSTVQFPSLAPGDIIDISYRTEDNAHGALSRQFWAQWYFDEPESQYVNSRFVLITPTDMAYNYVEHGSAPDPTEKESGAWRIREWDVANGLPVKAEPLEPPMSDWASWIDISTISSWKQIVDWYEDLSDPICIPSEPVKEKAAEITKGLTTDDQKIAAMVQYVSHDIQYQSTPFRLSAYVPTEGKDVIRERYGDCKDKAALLIALLSSVGIKGHMVLLSPRGYGTTPYLPSPRFAHAIAVVDAPGGPLWVDGTADGLDYRDLPQPDQGVPALQITQDTQDLTTVPDLPTQVFSNTRYDIKLGADGKATIQATLTAYGNAAWGLRTILKRVPADKQDDALREFAQKLVGADYDSGSITGMDGVGNQLAIIVNCHDDHFATPAGDFLLFGLPWVNMFTTDTSTLKTAGRVLPIDLDGQRLKNTADITLQLPDGYVPQDLATQTETNAWASYQFTDTVNGSELDCHAQDEGFGGTIAPTDAAAFLAFLTDKNTAASGKLVIKKS